MEETKRSPVLSFIFDILETVVISLAILLVVYIFFVQPHQVDGHSMDPTLSTGEYLLTNKITYRFNDPERGDIVVFHAPKVACYTGGNCDFIKRVIGLPGDSVELRDGTFYINGEPLAEPYLAPTVVTAAGNYIKDRTITLGEDQYFVAGDNRAKSSDSRLWGPITKKDIVGKAFFSYWPINSFGVIKDKEYDYSVVMSSPAPVASPSPVASAAASI